MVTMRFLVGCSTMGLGIGSLILGLFQEIFSQRFVLKYGEPLGFGVTTVATVGFANLDQYFECFLLLVILWLISVGCCISCGCCTPGGMKRRTGLKSGFVWI
ncbi:hypothetical protein BGZ57DRAFT_863639 [Hyaloscypha finlandica]|nr:hypothetical protein BGZ57DRAFT_863639 [Hyaloscypha finlandica]